MGLSARKRSATPKPRALIARSLLVARGFFFFGQRLVPNILAQPKTRVQRFGFALADFAALVQIFLNKRFVGGVFWNMFHEDEINCYAGPRQQQQNRQSWRCKVCKIYASITNANRTVWRPHAAKRLKPPLRGRTVPTAKKRDRGETQQPCCMGFHCPQVRWTQPLSAQHLRARNTR